MQIDPKLTRRQLAAALMASAAAAQTAAPQPTPDEDLKAARDRIVANRKALDAVPVPMSVEPAFQFKA
jgi:hypothetical protein